ncbi:MAG TPA: SPOR domain-containing protein [Ignavibacteriaceae bacterium]|nr:SPOR domain-containing protein [Ignavibacteriaceae bacterium]
MSIRNFILLLSTGFIFYSCSSMESTTRDNNTEVKTSTEDDYVFDEMPSDSIQLADENTKSEEDDVPLTTNTTKESTPNFKSPEFKKLDPPQNTTTTATTNNYSSRISVQLGAFTTKQKADYFVNQNKSLINKPTLVKLGKVGNLFVVQVPGFLNRNEAAQYRDKLKVHEQFKDAWIVIE